jgi:hypothetical protein
MDVLALIFSALSLTVAFGGTYLANKRAKEALDLSRRATADARWSALQEAVQRLIGFDPASEPIGERLANLRISMIGLVDELALWPGLDAWLESERILGATYGRQVAEAARPGDGIEERVNNLDPLMTWAQALSQNLRYFRAHGHNESAIKKLEMNATRMIKQLHDRNGWRLPPTANPRI